MIFDNSTRDFASCSVPPSAFVVARRVDIRVERLSRSFSIVLPRPSLSLSLFPSPVHLIPPLSSLGLSLGIVINYNWDEIFQRKGIALLVFIIIFCRYFFFFCDFSKILITRVHDIYLELAEITSSSSKFFLRSGRRIYLCVWKNPQPHDRFVLLFTNSVYVQTTFIDFYVNSILKPYRLFLNFWNKYIVGTVLKPKRYQIITIVTTLWRTSMRYEGKKQNF